MVQCKRITIFTVSITYYITYNFYLVIVYDLYIICHKKCSVTLNKKAVLSNDIKNKDCVYIYYSKLITILNNTVIR